MKIKQRTGELKEFVEEYWSKATRIKKSKYLYRVAYLKEKCIMDDDTIQYLELEREYLPIKYI